MPAQKGSLIDRLRSWCLFLKYKIKIAKKRKEEKKRKKAIQKELNKNKQLSATGKYYSKPKTFGLMIAGLFLGIFESKTSKQNKISEIENKVILLEQKIEVLSFKEHINIYNSIEKDIVELKLRNQFNENIKNRIQICETKLESINTKKEKINHQQNKNYNQKRETLNLSFVKLTEQKTNLKIDNNIKKNSSKRKKGVYTPVLEIKVINKEIKDYAKKLKEINDKIKNTTDYNNLYELEFAIKQLKVRFNDMLDRYNNLKELPGFDNLENILEIEDIDTFNLRFNADSIKLQIKICNNYLDTIENTRKEILNRKEENIKEKKKVEEKKEKKNDKEIKKEEKKIDNKLLEIRLANKIVLDRIANEKRNIIKFERSISKMGAKQRKQGIFYYTKNILSSIVNFSLSLFPLSIFKNKFIGALASGIMINNSLRSVRRVLTPDIEIIYILYNDFEKELNHTNDYLNNINYVCSDSLKQINEIRNIVYMQYGNDLEYSNFLIDYLKDLDSIESQILREQQTIIDLQHQVQVTKIKNKQKIKEWKG